MAKPNKPNKPKPNRPQGPLADRAQAQINMERRQAQQDYRNALAQAQGIYGAATEQLAPLGPSYTAQSQDIMQGLQGSLSQFANLMGTATPAGEQAAAAGLYGTLGAGGLSTLGSQQARNLAYQTSAMRQVPLEQATVGRNLLTNLNQELKDLRNPELFQSLLDKLREAALTRKLAMSQMQGNEATSQFLQRYIAGLIGGNPNPNRPNPTRPNQPSSTPPHLGYTTPSEVRRYP